MSLLHPRRHPAALPSFPTRRSSDLLFRMDESITMHSDWVTGVISWHILRGTERGTRAARAPKSRGKDEGERSEEHTSELQSRGHLVCRLLLEKKKKHITSSSRRRQK